MNSETWEERQIRERRAEEARRLALVVDAWDGLAKLKGHIAKAHDLEETELTRQALAVMSRRFPALYGCLPVVYLDE